MLQLLLNFFLANVRMEGSVDVADSNGDWIVLKQEVITSGRLEAWGLVIFRGHCRYNYRTAEIESARTSQFQIFCFQKHRRKFWGVSIQRATVVIAKILARTSLLSLGGC